MKYVSQISLMGLVILMLASCSNESQFTGWQTEVFDATRVTEAKVRTVVFANPSEDSDQHIRAIAFDRGSNAAGHFRMDKITVGTKVVTPIDIVVPPSSKVAVSISYSPQNLEITKATYGGWTTGEEERWIPKNPEDVEGELVKTIVQRAVIEVVYDYPKEGIYYVQVVGEALPGPHGEKEAGGAFATCTPGGGVMCYEGGFSLDIPALAPGGPKPLEITGPIKFLASDGTLTLRMDDFPYVIYYLRSTEIPQLPSGVTATLVISGAADSEATGSFDGARIMMKGVDFRIRVTLGELSIDQIKQGMSAMVDFVISDLEITTIKPLDQGAITMRLETTLPQNPTGNELFDQFLSGVKIVGVMEGKIEY